jgi:hypothetical protein
MKKLIYLLSVCFLFSSYSFSQTYSGVVELDSTFSKSILYSNGLSFFANTFKSSNNVIQMKDSESGKIIGKGIADDRNITITIVCKDGKYKYDILIEEPVGYTLTLKTNNFGYDKTWSYMNIPMDGVSKVTVTFDSNKMAIINKDDVYFEFNEALSTSSSPGAYRYYYNENHKGHRTCMGLGNNSSRYQDWKKMIDNEFIQNNNYSNITKPQDKIVNDLILVLKNEMSKSDW